MVHGIDVSEWQGPVDWPAVFRAGYRFAYIRASDSQGAHEDTQFAANWRRSGEAGLVRGAYHFARPSIRRTGAQDASWFHSLLAAAGTDSARTLPPALDLELPADPAAVGLSDFDAVYRWAKLFVEELVLRDGRAPLIYTGRYWKDHLDHVTDGWGSRLWLAQWGPTAQAPRAWPDWTCWQYSVRGRVPGIRGDADLNLFNGSEQELATLAGGPAPPDAPGAPAWPGRVLGLGTSGPDVSEWQLGMRARGFATLIVDGAFGPESDRACRRLQAYKGLPVDGRVGPFAWSATWGPL